MNDSNDSNDPMASIADERRARVEEEQKRRIENVSKDAFGEDSVVVLHDHAQVTFTIHPSLLPYTAINGRDLIERMNDRFGVSFQMPSMANPLNPDAPQGLTEAQIVDLPRHIKTSKLKLAFKDGFVSLNNGPTAFAAPTEIGAIEFSREHINVELTGPSDVAEMIAKECWEILWDLARGQVPRTFDELAKAGLQIVEQANATTIDLGRSPKALFDQRFISKIESLFCNTDGLSSKFRKHLFSDVKSSIPHNPSIIVDEIHFKVYVPSLGGSDPAPLQLRVMRVSDEGTSLISLVTKLPYEHHILVAKEVIASLEE